MIDMTEFNDNALPNRLFPIIRDLALGSNAAETALGDQAAAIDGMVADLADYVDSNDTVISGLAGALNFKPMFRADGGQGITGKILFPNARINAEYCYFAESSTFVCPVYGVYEFTMTVRAGATDSWCTIRVNGSEVGVALEVPSNKTGSITKLIHCNLGDSVTCSSSGALPAIANTCEFSGYLVKGD